MRRASHLWLSYKRRFYGASEPTFQAIRTLVGGALLTTLLAILGWKESPPLGVLALLFTPIAVVIIVFAQNSVRRLLFGRTETFQRNEAEAYERERT